MSNVMVNGIGPEVKLAIGTPAGDIAAGTVTGAAIDRTGFDSMVLHAQTGAVAGAPDTQTVDTKVTHCDTSGGSYTDWQPEGTAASGAVAQITAANTRKRKSMSLKGAKQFLKIVTVTAFTGGTSPKIGQAVDVILGSAVSVPAQADD
jgi:hypothetical protein